MINRVSENIKFTMINNSMSTIQSQYGELMEKISTQKNINRPSDDPIGTNDVLDYRTAKYAIEQYQTNITNADISLSIAETDLSAVKDLIAKAKDIAISESGAGGSTQTMDTSAAYVSSLIDEALSLMNTKQGDSYLFAGSNTNVAPFSTTYSPASIGTAAVASTNTFDGTVTASGAYTATENKTYAVKITGGTLAAANYQVSSDGGKSWTAGGVVDLSVPATISVGDGISLNFTAGTNLTTGDVFTVNGYTGGYYQGNNDNMTVPIGKDNNFVYNISGADAFTGPVASASVVGAGAALTANDTIVLTRGASSWSLTSNPNYPAMNITSQTASAVNIDADGDSVADITLSLSGKWNQNDTTTFTVTAGATPALSAVSVLGDGTVDLIGTLKTLKDALTSHNTDLISAQSTRLQTLETQVLTYETQAGSKREFLQITTDNHNTMNLQITNMLADIENADQTKLIVEFQMKQIALQASYEMASKIGKMTILDYI